MADRLAAPDLRQAFVDFGQEPGVVVNQPFDRFLRQRLWLDPTVVRDAASLTCRSAERVTSMRRVYPPTLRSQIA